MSARCLGPQAVQLLLRQRAPLLLVDRVTDWAFEPVPFLRAERQVAADEDVFRGHFPGEPIWPGIFTIEGLGQSSQLLAMLLVVRACAARACADPDAAIAVLADLDAGSAAPDPLRERVVGDLAAGGGTGMSAAVDVRLLQPVLPGDRLEYRVELTHCVGQALRTKVEASVGGRPVARGTLTSWGVFWLPKSP
jgi:3-hydroxyacyl-[acyl-carrier-protein] dehydratase